jgi:glycosyltransferase 2 family protein
MAQPQTDGRRPLIPNWLGQALVYAISLACLLWVYHDFNWRAELPRIQKIYWPWMMVAVGTDILVYVIQGWRWDMVLAPIQRLSLWRTVQAIYIGLFANEILPFRTGELIRTYLISSWNRISFPVVLSSALIERMMDGVWLILAFVAVSQFIEVSDALQVGAATLGLIVLLIAVILAFAVFNKRFTHHVVTRHRWSTALRSMVEAMNVMGRAKTFPKAFLASSLYLLLQVIPVYAIIHGYGVTSITLADAAVVTVILRLSTVVPGLPGNLGLFNAAAYTALHRLLGVDAQTAKSLSAVLFVLITVPLLAAGSLALALSGSRMMELYRRARDHSGNEEQQGSPVGDGRH